MYSDMSDSDLTTLRDKLRASLTDRLTKPTVAMGSGRRAEYGQEVSQIREELQVVQAEVDRRAGGTANSRRPIYLA
jgi:response regulator of citrate/malate metabolism